MAKTKKLETPTVKPKIMIATPMYDGVCTGRYIEGLINTITTMRDLGIQTYWYYRENESLITRARNECVRAFLETDADYLMFIDADIAFDGKAVAQLLYGVKDIACGVYPKKEVAWKRVLQAARDGHEDLSNYAGAFVFNMIGDQDAETDADGFIEVRHGGTGFMLIHRRVFEQLSSAVPEYRISTNKDPITGEYEYPLVKEFFTTSIDPNGTLLSEDYHFCELWRANGGSVHVNPFIKLGHVGKYTFTGDIIKAGGNLK